MANVSILGGTAGEVVIPTTSAAVASSAQAALDAISARITAGTDFVESYTGTGSVAQPTTHETALLLSAATRFVMPTTSLINAIVSDAAAPIAIDDERAIPVTVVSGTGGLSFTRTSSGAGPAVILATGGVNTINVGTGAATVAAGGSSTVSALGGAASILAAAGGFALVSVGGADTAVLAGTDTVAFTAATAAAVTALDGSNLVFSGGSGQVPIVQMGAGTEILGTMAGSTSTVQGTLGGMMLVSAWGGRTLINPGAANVTVFSGSGTETLFGTGDASLPGVTVPSGTKLSNTGSDFVFGGQGYFHGGSGALNLLISSTVTGAATLVGGGKLDLLFGQGAGDVLRGTAGTLIINAAGFSEPGFSVSGASAGAVLDAGASSAFMFGAAWGANTILSGSGAATVFGNHGITATGAPGKVGNVYFDAGGGGSLAILDFLPGADIVSLNGASISGVADVTAAQAQGSTAPGTYVSLSDGTTIGFVDQFLTGPQVAAAFR